MKSAGLNWVSKGGGAFSLFFSNIISMPFEIGNVGNGAAINTTIVFSKKDEKRRGVNIFTLETGEGAYCHIFVEEPNKNLYGEYILELIYNDVLGNSFSQKYNLEIVHDQKTNKSFGRIDLFGEQTRNS